MSSSRVSSEILGRERLPLLPGAEGDEEGTPLYAPSRVGLFLKLERDGYSSNELRSIARSEEWMIDNVLTTDELEYLDDNIQTLLLHAEERVEGLRHGTKFDAKGQRIDQTQELDTACRELEFLRRLQVADTISENLREPLAKHAFRVRALNEFIRTQLLEGDRAKIRAGYSPFVACGTTRHTTADGKFSTDSIVWDVTVQAAIAHGDGGQLPPIRVPGFILHGERVIPIKTLRPAEYESLWKASSLDKYLEAWATAHGERR